MKRKYFWGAWLCILFFASGFAQADRVNADSTFTVNTATVENASTIDSTLVVAKTETTTSSKSYFGVASYYAKKFEGRKTATGEIFRHTNYTAASNNFKLNTWVKVTNIKNGKSVIVRINDRMAPSMSAKGRIVDLTTTAAKEIGIIYSGTGKVKVEILENITKR